VASLKSPVAGIAGAAECDCTCMIQYFAQAFRTPYRCCGAWALDGLRSRSSSVVNGLGTKLNTKFTSINGSLK
jgi:hypothetical protein